LGRTGPTSVCVGFFEAKPVAFVTDAGAFRWDRIMLGVFRIDQSGSAVTKFLCESGFDNAFAVDAEQHVVCELDHHVWRRMLARGVDDAVSIDALMSTYAACAAMGSGKLRRNEFPWVRAEVHAEAGVLPRLMHTSAVYPATRPASAVGLIMAGGFGRRLGDLTRDTPKPMLDLGGKPIAAHLVENFVRSGINELYLSVFHLANVVKGHFGDGSRYGSHVQYLEETAPLGTAGCLSLLPRNLDKPIVMVNGDVVTKTQFGRLLDFHERSKFDVTVSIRPLPMQVQFGVVEQVNGLVTRIREKPRFIHHINVAVYVLSPKVLAHIPPGKRLDMPTLIENLMPLGYNVGVFPLVESWLDVGTVGDLAKARAEYDRTSVTPSAEVVMMEEYRASA
jgi:dTDP-glucose pyrophosphorylase